MLRACRPLFEAAAVKRVAVVLSGCGVYDGSEIHEATSVLIHLDRRGLQYTAFAPFINQHHVINHLTGEPEADAVRSVASEASRISRSPVSDTKSLAAADFDAVIFPGGFGAMKNLSDMAFSGENGEVEESIAKILKDFHSNKKPIGVCCIAPMLAARVLGKSFGGPGLTLTLGSVESDFVKIAEGFGNQLVACDVDGCIVDEANKVVSSPAYMYDTTPYNVYKGIGKLVTAVNEL